MVYIYIATDSDVYTTTDSDGLPSEPRLGLGRRLTRTTADSDPAVTGALKVRALSL